MSSLIVGSSAVSSTRSARRKSPLSEGGVEARAIGSSSATGRTGLTRKTPVELAASWEREPDAQAPSAMAKKSGMRRFIRLGFRRSEEHTSELQSRLHLVCRLLLEKKKQLIISQPIRS